ncbi:meiotic recombination protein SPO11-1-like [Miscanthus floridulus]|uniref:meiotic recombination protein SPO11-1-like n=1 Tax=Miscanthus floridulus TaxID=154761 RepID=UPI0034587E3D
MGGIAGCRIPAEAHNVTKIRLRGKIEYILVEKEDIFEELAADNFSERNNCVLFSGKGQPSANTRLMLHMLRDTLGVPVYSVFDGNYSGALIYCTYKFGSANRAYDSLLLTVPDLVWLGVFSDEVKKEYRSVMKDEDHEKLHTLMYKSYMVEFPDVQEKLVDMHMRKQVCDMEMIRMDGNLSKYIEGKVKSFAIPDL